MAAAKHALPPPPIPPSRGLWAPARRPSGTYGVEPDAETPRKPVELTTYQSLLGYFDGMTPEQRLALLEIAAAIPDLSREELGWVVEMATKGRV